MSQTLQIEVPMDIAVQALLKRIEQSATAQPSLPAVGTYWKEQGGIYAGIVRGEDGQPDHHLIVATDPSGHAESVAWGGYEIDEPDATHERDGLANTLALVESDADHPAAEWAAGLIIEGHADWYLPARRELRLLWINVPELFEDDWYWSSTQYSPLSAWTQDFDGGVQISGHKVTEGRARAVRRLSVI